MRLKFQQIDVFTTERFSGNPLAVFWDATDLSDTATMAVSLSDDRDYLSNTSR